MDDQISAIVLCAGEGVRLRPLTEHLAKPLFPIFDEPLLFVIFRNLEKAGISHIGINVWHRKEDFFKVMPFFNGKVKITIVPEKELLGTAGGMANVLSHLKSEGTIVVHNGDIFCDIDLRLVIENHKKNDAMITLLVRKGAEEVISENNIVLDIANRINIKGSERWKFIGISVWEKSMLSFLPSPGKPGNLLDTFEKILRENPGFIKVFDVGDAIWSDIGTIEEYKALHSKICEKFGKNENPHLLESLEGVITGFLDGYIRKETAS